MASRKMALAAFLVAIMVVIASMDIGEAIRYRMLEPCFTDCVRNCMAVGDSSSPWHCREQCRPLCSKLECFFCFFR
ncbi:hypothetical protein TorRG33x02_151790 [Trema orientale]|uniref:Thionin-like protein n=2 Tax=Cannabaceae TaxID=3481 RepID=A0A2P5AU51_PARAD|nr:hypothetical protein PanWU01x14_300130 [Parasponia andersonii]PON88950.1 hypothetical protein TorRG33x02_151790 [Trema orientale]